MKYYVVWFDRHGVITQIDSHETEEARQAALDYFRTRMFSADFHTYQLHNEV